MVKKTLLVAAGTRPEVIKICPVLDALKKLSRRDLDVITVSTGQHQKLADAAWKFFGYPPALAKDQMGGLSRAETYVLVQGDTRSAFISAIESFNNRCPIIHLEAGLRSHVLTNPYPEEGYRRMIDQISSLLLAPTPLAMKNLQSENVLGRIVVTGNTGIDSLLKSYKKVPKRKLQENLVLWTIHRRESRDSFAQTSADILFKLAINHPQLNFVVPVHPSEAIKKAYEMVGGQWSKARQTIHICEPLPYADTIGVLSRCLFVVTDSGGLQEEASAFRRPTFVLRDITDRPESVKTGNAFVLGREKESVFSVLDALCRIYSKPGAKTGELVPGQCEFGDGKSGMRSAIAIRDFLGLKVDKKFRLREFTGL